MKTQKIIYWATSIFIGAMMIASSITDLSLEKVALAYKHLGFPSYFRIELAISKFIGAILLLVPIKSGVKEWPYIGFAITFISATYAHFSSGDPLSEWAIPLFPLLILSVSYIYYKKLQVIK